MIEKRGVIAADHPALPGHFPGEPIVPGVVLLDQVMALCGARTLPWVKFHAPLHPGEEFVIRVEDRKFNVRRGDALIMSGVFA